MLVEGERIRALSERPIRSAAAETIDLAGDTLMPGLIDAHVHVLAVDAALARLADRPVTLLTLQASRVLEGMLMRGFTTVRDAGGRRWRACRGGRGRARARVRASSRRAWR